MTNFEYWKDRILEITEYDGIAVIDDKPLPCNESSCIRCIACYESTGNKNLIKWLYSEHVEKPKLTKRERAMCEVLEYGWIAADIDGTVYWYETVPHQFDTYYECEGECTGLSQIGLKFNFITFHTGPWKVVDLLQLEVEE